MCETKDGSAAKAESERLCERIVECLGGKAEKAPWGVSCSLYYKKSAVGPSGGQSSVRSGSVSSGGSVDALGGVKKLHAFQFSDDPALHFFVFDRSVVEAGRGALDIVSLGGKARSKAQVDGRKFHLGDFSIRVGCPRRANKVFNEFVVEIECLACLTEDCAGPIEEIRSELEALMAPSQPASSATGSGVGSGASSRVRLRGLKPGFTKRFPELGPLYSLRHTSMQYKRLFYSRE